MPSVKAAATETPPTQHGCKRHYGFLTTCQSVPFFLLIGPWCCSAHLPSHSLMFHYTRMITPFLCQWVTKEWQQNDKFVANQMWRGAVERFLLWILKKRETHTEKVMIFFLPLEIVMTGCDGWNYSSRVAASGYLPWELIQPPWGG